MVAASLVQRVILCGVDGPPFGNASCSPLRRSGAIWWGKEHVTPSASGRKLLSKKLIVPFLATLMLVSVHLAQAQQGKVYRVGVIHEGGPYNAVVDGLKDGLRELGFAEGKQYVLEIRDLKGDPRAIEEAARSLEHEKVNLIYALGTSVSTVVKRATTEVPIVFDAGTDPVAAGLIESFARPGGRITGVYYSSIDLTAKRLEILKSILPELRRVVTFYNPRSEFSLKSAKAAREEGRQLSIEIVERPVASVEELRPSMNALKAKDADAYFYVADAMVLSQAQYIIDAARAKKLPTMFADYNLVKQGALAAYGVSYYEVGRLSAKYVQRILTGTSPQDLPAESLSKIGLAVNLKTARELGITIPQSLLLRADEVIE
jgi:putative ABC transport system substrate-binding protein